MLVKTLKCSTTGHIIQFFHNKEHWTAVVNFNSFYDYTLYKPCRTFNELFYYLKSRGWNI